MIRRASPGWLSHLRYSHGPAHLPVPDAALGAVSTCVDSDAAPLLVLEGGNATSLLQVVSTQRAGHRRPKRCPLLDVARLYDLIHQFVVPFALGFENGLGVIQERLNQVVGEIDICPRLTDGVNGGPGGPGRDVPGLQVQGWWVVEAAAFPDIVAMAANQVWVRLPVGLSVDDEHIFTHPGGQLPVALQRPGNAVENDVGRDEGPHGPPGRLRRKQTGCRTA